MNNNNEINISTIGNGNVGNPSQRDDEISISAVAPQEQSFDLTSGAVPVDYQQQSQRPQIRVPVQPVNNGNVPNPARSFNQSQPVNGNVRIDPTSFNSNQLQSGNRTRIDPASLNLGNKRNTQTMRSERDVTRDAFNDIQRAIHRKHQEAEEALRLLDERNEQNRISVAEGLENVNGYIDYYKPEKDENVNKVQSQREIDDNFDEELERDLTEMDINANLAAGYSQSHNTNTRVLDPYSMNTTPTIQPGYYQPPTYQEDAAEQNQDVEVDLADDEYYENNQQYSTDDNNSDSDVQHQEDDKYISYEGDAVARASVRNNIDIIQKDEEIKENVPEMDIHQTSAEEQHKETMENMFGKKGVMIVQAPSDVVTDPKPLTKLSNDDFNIDPEDFADVDDISKEEKEKNDKEMDRLQKDGLMNLRNEVLNKIVNTARKFDVSSFKVSKKTASLQEVLTKSKKTNGTVKSTATWALMNVGRPYICSALTGPEIVMMATNDEGQNSAFVSNTQQLKVLYGHDENPYKAPTFEGWCKTIPYTDIDGIFMASYIATFNKANYLPYYCTNDKCSNMELKDQKDIINTMVKFKNDKVKEKFNKIRETELSPDISNEYETVIVPINENIAIGFKQPSIYNMLIELRSVSPAFLDKYAAIVTVINYIDTIYQINPVSEEFERVDYKQYTGDVSKTFKSKIATYARILNTFTTNEFNILIAYTNSISGNEDDVTYVIPEAKCSKCGHTIEEALTTGKDLVFTQQRLVNIATISIE